MLNTSESYRQAMDKLQALVNTGRAGATKVIEDVMTNQPTDRIVRGSAILFKPDTTRNGVVAEVPVGSGERGLRARSLWEQECCAVSRPRVFCFGHLLDLDAQ